MFELQRVTYDVTNACNLRCKHCYSNAGTSHEDDLSLDEIKKLFTELYDLGTLELLMSGRGEPFMRSDFVKILNLANSMDFSLGILTNGTLLDKNKVRALSDFSIKKIQIPVEGMREAHEFTRGIGTFDSAINAINMLIEEGLKVQVRTTVTRKSLYDLENLANLFKNLNVDQFLITEFIPVGHGFRNKNELLLTKDERILYQTIFNRIKEKYKNSILVRGGPYGYFSPDANGIIESGKSSRSSLCGALRGDWCEILPNGDVTPCDSIQFYAGNIRFQRIEDIWNNSRVFKFFRNFNPADLKGACGGCDYKILCGGCRALAFLFYGDFYEEDPTCWKAYDNSLGFRMDCTPDSR